MRKKRVLIHSNYSRAFTGFGKNAKNILRYLFNTEKYEIMELANGKGWADQDLILQPWKSHGSLPPSSQFATLDAKGKRLASYGSFGIDKAISDFRPDVYLGIEDIWAFEGYNLRPWWNKITPIIWTTLDSLPILDMAVDFAPSLKHYFVWASFAEKALKNKGYDQVETLHGAVETQHFFKKSSTERNYLRKKFGLQDSFVVGFVFRNQLRKSVPNLLQGFKKFLAETPNAKLLLHTSWEEGWDIEKLIEENNIPKDSVLTTYVCSSCKEMSVRSFCGKFLDCPSCGAKKTFKTTGINNGVSEEQLNDVYNLMDVYCHPFTSGGQELPIQEAKLTELITLVTNYSCGEDSCHEESGGFPLEWSEYREPGTQFIKASTSPNDIFEKLSLVFNMSPEDRKKMGEKSRKYVIDNYSIDVIGERLQKIIDEAPLLDDEEDLTNGSYCLEYNPNEGLSDDDFLIEMHKKCLGEAVDKNHTSFKIWKDRLKIDDKQKILDHFNRVARSKLEKPKELSDILDPKYKDKRIAVVIPQSSTDVFLINSLCGNIKELYDDCDLYIFTHPALFPFIEDNPAVHKCLPFKEDLSSFGVLEGIGIHKGYFKCAFFPTFSTQEKINYIHNASNKHQFSLT